MIRVTLTHDFQPFAPTVHCDKCDDTRAIVGWSVSNLGIVSAVRLPEGWWSPDGAPGLHYCPGHARPAPAQVCTPECMDIIERQRTGPVEWLRCVVTQEADSDGYFGAGGVYLRVTDHGKSWRWPADGGR